MRCGPETWLRSPAWLSILFLPPFIYLAALVPTVTLRRRRADPMALRSKQAYGALKKALNDLRRQEKPGPVHAALLDALREYLGSKLRQPAAALTFADVAGPLEQGGADNAALSDLRGIFERCEAGSYAGGAAGADGAGGLVEETLSVASRLEKAMRRRG